MSKPHEFDLSGNRHVAIRSGYYAPGDVTEMHPLYDVTIDGRLVVEGRDAMLDVFSDTGQFGWNDGDLERLIRKKYDRGPVPVQASVPHKCSFVPPLKRV